MKIRHFYLIFMTVWVILRGSRKKLRKVQFLRTKKKRKKKRIEKIFY